MIAAQSTTFSTAGAEPASFDSIVFVKIGLMADCSSLFYELGSRGMVVAAGSAGRVSSE